MAKKRTITYECEQCGSEIVVTSTGEGELSPIYCCGIEATHTPSAERKAVRSNKKAVKKVSGKKAATKKNISSRKMPSKQ